MNNYRILFSVLLAAAALQGCANLFNPVGESTFDCNRKENPSEYCRSFKAVEKSTNGTLPDSRFDQPFRMTDLDIKNGVAKDPNTPGATSTGGLPQSTTRRLYAETSTPAPGDPVRNAPLIQRVWIKGYVDENDVLHSDTTLYHEIQQPHWNGYQPTGAADDIAGLPVYPHRPAQQAVPAVDKRTMPPTQNFNQPGYKPARTESAMPPADQSGGTSMPN